MGAPVSLRHRGCLGRLDPPGRTAAKCTKRSIFQYSGTTVDEESAKSASEKINFACTAYSVVLKKASTGKARNSPFFQYSGTTVDDRLHCLCLAPYMNC